MTSNSLDDTNRMKAYSLPSILNSDIDNDDNQEAGDARDAKRSPSSLASCVTGSKFSPLHITPWKHPPRKFKRKSGGTFHNTMIIHSWRLYGLRGY
jgi:hypothetical protein